MGPDRIVMRIIVAPDEIVYTDKMARQHADGVVFKGGVELTLKIRAGFHGEVRRGLAARPVGGMVEALQNVPEPAGFKFSTDKFETGVTRGDATADELPDRGHDAAVSHGVADDARAWTAPVRRQAHIRRAAAEDVHGDG